jgi:hypothetical protein
VAEGEAARLVRVGLPRAATYAETVECDGCHRACIERVEFVNGGEGIPPRAYVACTERDDIGRVRVDLERLQQWEASGQLLADTVAGLLGGAGSAEEIVPRRLWWLGALHHGGRRRDVFLASGATAADAPATSASATRLSECSAAVVLVPWTVPERNPFPGGAPVLSLGRPLTLQKGRLRLDVAEIVAAHRKRRPKRVQGLVPLPTPLGTTWEQVVIEFANDEYVKVGFGSPEVSKSYAEMGFADRRRPRAGPDTLRLLLRVLATREGRLRRADEGAARSGPRAFTKRQVSDLRLRLRQYFGISDDPFRP